MRKKPLNAFTLVELLVVIGIIAVLMSILLPSLNKARAQSQAVQCMSNLRQFGLGIQMYADSNNGTIPYKGPDGSNTTSNNFGPGSNPLTYVDDLGLWFNAIPKYMVNKTYYDMLVDDQKGISEAPKPGQNNIFVCPSAAQSGSISNKDFFADDATYFALYGTDSYGILQTCKAGSPKPMFKFACSYVYNSKFTDTNAGNGPNYCKMSQLKPSSLVVTMVEKMTNAGEYTDKTVQAYCNAVAAADGASRASDPVVKNITVNGLNNNVSQPKSNWKRMTTRHRSGGNLLFADGHVEWMSWVDAQVPLSQLPYNALNTTANQPNKIIWSVYGPIN